MTETEININNYIDIYTTQEVKYKGEKLYGLGAVEFKVYAENTDTWKFFVKGNQNYRVTINGVNNNAIEATCTCSSGWGGGCIHTVASLLFIIDYKNNQNNPLSIRANESFDNEVKFARRSEIGLKHEIIDYERITRQIVKDNVSERLFNQLSFYSQFIELIGVELKDEKLCFEIENDETKVMVTFDSENDKIYISTSEYSQTGQISLTAAHCLLMIANSDTPTMLDDIFNHKLLENEAKLLNSFGLGADADFNNYFYYDFDLKKGLIVNRTDESTGLVPVENEEIDPYKSFINKTSSKELVFEGLFSNKQKRDVGFVLRFDILRNDEDSVVEDNDFESFYEIVPIIGKTNKTETVLHTNIEAYVSNSDYQINKSINTKKLLDAVGEISWESDGPIEFQLKKRAFKYLTKESFIYGLKENAYALKKGNLVDIDVSPICLDIIFEIKKDANFIYSEMKIKVGDIVFNYQDIDFSKSDYQICVIHDIYYFVKNYKVSQYLKNYPGNLKMVNTHQNDFFKQVIQPISKDFVIHFTDDTYKVDAIELDFNKKQLFLSEQNDFIVMTPQVVYDNNITALLHSSGNILVDSENGILEYKRNQELEDDYIDLIADFHPNFESQKSRQIFSLHFSEFAQNMWFYKFFDLLKANNIEVYGLKNLKNFKYSPYKGKINTTVSSGQDWFEVDVAISFGDNKVSLSDIRKAVINKQRYIKLNDGSVGVLPTEWFSKLEKFFRHGEIKDDKLAISKLKFSIVDDLFDTIDDATIIQEIADKKHKLATFTEISNIEIPDEITADLRHYQKEGLNWLNFLNEMQWGGILADDMGLGKTLQILTFLQHLVNKESSTSLIVVPTTLLFNWEKEIQKFAPELKAFYHYGPDRQKNVHGFEDYHIVFTTYGILLRDIEMLRDFRFNYVILDESQAIKNPASRRYKAANLINANNRIALSGTPIENGTFDLYAQMSFANRGFFAGANAFKDGFSNPIDKEGNELIACELQKLINPFILRRTKEKVATELPAKTEDIIYCEMEAEQRQVYDAYRNNYKNQLLAKVAEDGMGKSKIMVLEALTRLRQICDSPALVNKDHITDAQSIKVKEIIRHITNKTANHKILIFSQFVKMLTIVKNELNKLNIDYEYLDGKSSTKQRENSVNNFQENDDLRVFLISLKAGGTGLNLTAADYVYILDPWWNPAVENQAIDRCYRIGQDKKVFAYRMICKDTVEEKIVNLQNKKKKIAGDIIQTDENIMKTLTTDDIQELFS
ncbi:MAG: DEAD/DEAH box helicase [Salinivirgaceae bacterium]|nr:DEAD/DEAH box helicase [Salinivirgaceae bacterium]